MELVPILSTIILVGTIATFILAVAAYILYKIRERRAREEGVVQTQSAPDSHVLVAPQQPQMIAQAQTQPQTTPQTNVYVSQQREQQHQQHQQQAQTVPQVAAPSSQQNSLFWEYTDEGFVPVRPEDAAKEQEERRQSEQSNDDGFAWL